MMTLRSRAAVSREVPESLDEWLKKWEPKIAGLRKKRGKVVAVRASGALDELEFLLKRVVENQISE
jgi:hypothetical protein